MSVNLIERYDTLQFVRPSTDIDQRGKMIGINRPRLVPTPAGMGIRIHEGAKNLIENGNFIRGFDGWQGGSLGSIQSNIARFTVTSQYAGLSQGFPASVRDALKGHKVYLAAYVKSDSASVYLLWNDGIGQTTKIHSGNGAFERLSLLRTIDANANTCFIKVQDGRANGWTEVQVYGFIAVDMGLDASNPFFNYTKEQMDLMFPAWFDGTRAAEQVLIPTYGKPKAGGTATNLLDATRDGTAFDASTATWPKANLSVALSATNKLAGNALECTVTSVASAPYVYTTMPLPSLKTGDNFTVKVRLAGIPGRKYSVTLRETGGAQTTSTVGASAVTDCPADGALTLTASGAVVQPDRTGLVIIIGTDAATSQIGDKFYVQLVQLEQSSRAGSWVPGGMRRYLDATQGEIGFLVKIDATTRRQVANNSAVLCKLSRINGSSGLFVSHGSNVPTWYATTYSDSGASTSNSFSDGITTDGWHRVVVTWTLTALKVYIDGVLATTISNQNMPSAFGELLRLGAIDGATYFANTVFADLYFRSEPRTDAEIAVNPLSAYVWDAKTTLKPSFEPVQRYYPGQVRL